MFEKKVLNIYSVIIGVLFIISGIGKVIDTAGFSNLIYQYGLGALMVLSPAIVLFELLLGLFLIFLIKPKRYAMISFFLLVIFTISFVYAHFKNGVNDCGCFGSIQPANMPFIFSFIRNIILIIMSLILWIKYPNENSYIFPWKKNFIIVAMGVSIFIAGFTFETPFFFYNKPETHKFQNQNIINTDLSKYIKTSKDSTYLFFCFSYTCPHCWNSIENLRQYKKNKTVDSVVVFATGSDTSKVQFMQNFHPDFPIKDLPIDAMLKLTDKFPTSFYVENDTIKVVIESELPSSMTFKSQFQISNN